MKKLFIFFVLLPLLNTTRGELAFLAVGDWGRDGKDGQRENAVQMGKTAEALHNRFVLSMGDNFYDYGVKTPTDSQWKTSFEDIYTAESLQTPWFVALGNHDYKNSAQAQIDYTATSKRWRMPARYFTWTEKIDDQTTAQFFCIDTSPFVAVYRAAAGSYGDVGSQDPRVQLAWLEKELAASRAQWKIVFGHHPVYSAGTKHGDTAELVVNLKPLLEKYGVQVYLAGHEHDLQFLRDDGPVYYFVSGAGSDMRGTGKNKHTVFSTGESSGFLAAQLSAQEMKVEFIDLHGKLLYETNVPAEGKK